MAKFVKSIACACAVLSAVLVPRVVAEMCDNEAESCSTTAPKAGSSLLQTDGAHLKEVSFGRSKTVHQHKHKNNHKNNHKGKDQGKGQTTLGSSPLKTKVGVLEADMAKIKTKVSGLEEAIGMHSASAVAAAALASYQRAPAATAYSQVVLSQAERPVAALQANAAPLFTPAAASSAPAESAAQQQQVQSHAAPTQYGGGGDQQLRQQLATYSQEARPVAALQAAPATIQYPGAQQLPQQPVTYSQAPAFQAGTMQYGGAQQMAQPQAAQYAQQPVGYSQGARPTASLLSIAEQDQEVYSGAQEVYGDRGGVGAVGAVGSVGAVGAVGSVAGAGAATSQRTQSPIDTSTSSFMAQEPAASGTIKERVGSLERDMSDMKSRIVSLENEVNGPKQLMLLEESSEESSDPSLQGRIVSMEAVVDDLKTRVVSLEHIVLG